MYVSLRLWVNGRDTGVKWVKCEVKSLITVANIKTLTLTILALTLTNSTLLPTTLSAPLLYPAFYPLPLQHLCTPRNIKSPSWPVRVLIKCEVQGASLWCGNLWGVMRGMQLLVSDFPWTSQFIHFRCSPFDAWWWPQHTVSPSTDVLGHKSHGKIPILTPHYNVRWLEWRLAVLIGNA